MKFEIRMNICSAALAGAILLSTAAGAQQRGSLVSSRPTASYDMTREIVLQGTVLNYTENSALPPIGAHVTVQTAIGTVDVHLGPASYLRGNNFFLSAGDSVRVVGINMVTNKGTVFLARIAQKGDQSIAIRSIRGFLRATSAARALPQAQRAQITQQQDAR